MAGRQYKEGLDYFSLDCHMDEKVELIEAEYGLKGFAIIVKLYQSIYSGFGYYCEWTPDISVLWARRLGVSHSVGIGDVGKVDDKACALPGFPNNLMNNVVAASIRRNIFSEELFNKFGILSSSGIQKRYISATYERKKVELKKEYLLISIPKNRNNVVINSINRTINSININKNEQSKGKESKVNKNTMCIADANALFESLWKLYPLKRGKDKVSDTNKLKLLEIGLDEMSRAIDRYKTEWEKDSDWRKPQNGSTFFNSGYVDYLDANYVPGKSGPQKKSGFNQFQQNDYDFNELEKELLRN